MGLKGQSKQSSNFEKTLFPEGTYDMRLKKVVALWGNPTQFNKEGGPKIMFVWEWTDDEGNDFELTDYLGFPKNIAYNEKSKFWKRVGEIAGLSLTDENADLLDLDLGPYIETYADLVAQLQMTGDNGKKEKVDVPGILVGDQQLIGKRCRLVVGIWNNGEKEGNEVARVMQIPTGGATGPKRPSKAPATAQAAPAAQASRPPARPAVPAPRVPDAPAQYDANGEELPY